MLRAASEVCSHLAAVLQHAVRESAVALRADLHVIGALQQHSFLQVARVLVHVGNAVLAVVGQVLGRLSGQKSQKVQLDSGSDGSGAVLGVAELHRQKSNNCGTFSKVCVQGLCCKRALTWNPPFMVSPNQTCLRSLALLLHQSFFGILAMLG